jgi:hypothetical protein
VLGELASNPLAAYGDALAANPVGTKMLTAGSLIMLGDAVSQAGERRGSKLAEAPDGGHQEQPFDWLRGASFFVFGAAYTGAFQHWWFGALMAAFPTPPPGAGVLDQLLAAAVKTGLCQFFTIPLIYLPFFFAITGLLRGLTAEQAWSRARELYLPLYTRNISFWIPAQMIQFLFVDPGYQVTYCCFAGLIWGVVLSQVAGVLRTQRGKHARGDAVAGRHPPRGTAPARRRDQHTLSMAGASRGCSRGEQGAREGRCDEMRVCVAPEGAATFSQ